MKQFYNEALSWVESEISSITQKQLREILSVDGRSKGYLKSSGESFADHLSRAQEDDLSQIKSIETDKEISVKVPVGSPKPGISGGMINVVIPAGTTLKIKSFSKGKFAADFKGREVLVPVHLFF